MLLFERLRSLYLRIGIHASPPGTLFHFIHSRVRALLHRHARRYASGDLFARGTFGGTPYYDIGLIRRSRQVDGLALVFFVGLGDYLFATPVIEALRVAHPGLLIHAYATGNSDAVSSALVADMLRSNRYVDAVFTYRGQPRRHWIDYDFSDCLKDIPRNFIILPVIYSIDPAVTHRVTSLFETFNLPVALPVPVPLVEPADLSSPASAILEEIRRRLRQHGPRPIVVCHFGTRSSDYLYPERAQLVSLLLRAGRAVVTLTHCDVEDPLLIQVDVGRISPADTIEMLRRIRNDGAALFILSVNSVMWPVSSALGIVNLGLHVFFDPAVHQYIYPNIFVLTRYLYPRVSPGRMFLADPTQYAERLGGGTLFTDFNAGFVFDCFESVVRGFSEGRCRPRSGAS